MDGRGKKQKKLIVVCGPTATGKTELALHLAKTCGGCVVSADSMQIYENLKVGTAAVTAEQAGDVKVYLSGFVPPQNAYSVAQWLQDAKSAIDECYENKLVPIVCGGTGLYIKNLLTGERYTQEEQDDLRKELSKQYDAQGGEAMLMRLAQVDAQMAARLHPNDKKRVVRALELWERTHMTEQQRNEQKAAETVDGERYSSLCIGLNYAERESLYTAINTRVGRMVQSGILDEAKCVWENKEIYLTAAQAIGYKEFFGYFEGTCSLQECEESLKQATRRYAKRQLSWFGGMEDIRWLHVGQENLYAEAQRMAEDFLG